MLGNNTPPVKKPVRFFLVGQGLKKINSNGSTKNTKLLQFHGDAL